MPAYWLHFSNSSDQCHACLLLHNVPCVRTQVQLSRDALILALNLSLTLRTFLDLDLLGSILLLAVVSRSGWRLRLALQARTLLGRSVGWSDQAFLALLSWRWSGLLSSFLALLTFDLRSAAGFVGLGSLGLWSRSAFFLTTVSLACGALLWGAPFGKAVGDGLWSAVCDIIIKGLLSF